MDAGKQPGIEIVQIVLERALFEHRPDYFALPHTTPIQDLPLRIQAQFGLDSEKRSGVIRVALTTDREPQPLYVIDLTMSALVSVKAGEENMPIERYATTSGLAMLFPFVREAVANLTSRGRFGPLWLHPLNVVAGVEQAGVQLSANTGSPPALNP